MSKYCSRIANVSGVSPWRFLVWKSPVLCVHVMSRPIMSESWDRTSMWNTLSPRLFWSRGITVCVDISFVETSRNLHHEEKKIKTRLFTTFVSTSLRKRRWIFKISNDNFWKVSLVKLVSLENWYSTPRIFHLLTMVFDHVTTKVSDSISFRPWMTTVEYRDSSLFIYFVYLALTQRWNTNEVQYCPPHLVRWYQHRSVPSRQLCLRMVFSPCRPSY